MSHGPRPDLDPPDGVHPTDDELIDVAHGLVDGPGQELVLRHLAICADCERRFLAVAREREMLRASTKPRLAGPGVVTVDRTDRPRSRRRGWVLLAAAAAAVAALMLPSLRSGEETIPEHWLPREPAYRYLRTTSSDHASDLLSVLDAYERRDVAGALGLLEPLDIVDDDALRTLTRIYHADLLLRQTRDGAEPLRLLDSIDISTVPPPWRYEARWIRYVALRLQQRRPEAMQTLTGLKDAPGELGELARQELARSSR